MYNALFHFEYLPLSTIQIIMLEVKIQNVKIDFNTGGTLLHRGRSHMMSLLFSSFLTPLPFVILFTTYIERVFLVLRVGVTS